MKKFLPYLIILLIAIIVSFLLWKKCDSENKIEINHTMITLRIEEMGKLEVVKYNIQNIIEYKKMRDWLPNAKTMLVAVGEVVGCVDLAKITAEDVTVTSDSIHILLPYPEICYCKIDHSRSKVYDVSYGWWNTANLVDDAYRYAEKQLYAEALNMGIEAESRKNVIKILTSLLNTLGFDRVGFSFKQPDYNEHPFLFQVEPLTQEEETAK